MLVIEKIREEEFGSYSCHASNNLGKDRSHLTVKGKDQFYIQGKADWHYEVKNCFNILNCKALWKLFEGPLNYC